MSKFTIQRRKECSDFIRNHHGAMTQPEMTKQLGVSKHTITRMIDELGLKQRHYKKRNPRPAMEHRSGIFNVNVHKDWLIGKK